MTLWRKLVLGTLGLASLLSVSCREIPNEEFPPREYNQKSEVVNPAPHITHFPYEDVKRGDVAVIPVRVLNFDYENDQFSVEGPANTTFGKLDDRILVFYRACGFSEDSSEETIEMTATNSSGKTDTSTIDLSVIPRENPLYFKDFNTQISLALGNSVSINAIDKTSGAELFIEQPAPSWASIKDKELFVNPHFTYGSTMTITADDGCYFEQEDIGVNATPIEIDGVVYNYYRHIQDREFLVREAGREHEEGWSNEKMDSFFPELPESFEWAYEITNIPSQRKNLLHIGEDSVCESVSGAFGIYRILNGIGHGCYLTSTQTKHFFDTSIHEIKGHGALMGIIANKQYFGGDGRVQESWAYILGSAKIYDCEKLSDFPEWIRTRTHLQFVFDLFREYGPNGLDTRMTEMTELFNLMNQKAKEKGSYLTLVEYKCNVLDNWAGEDTSDVYCANYTCSTEIPLIMVYNIPRYYCGD